MSNHITQSARGVYRISGLRVHQRIAILGRLSQIDHNVDVQSHARVGICFAVCAIFDAYYIFALI
jgi:hypothetical protein